MNNANWIFSSINKSLGISATEALTLMKHMEMSEYKQKQQLEKLKGDILEETKAYIDRYLQIQFENNVGPAIKEIDEMMRSIGR